MRSQATRLWNRWGAKACARLALWADNPTGMWLVEYARYNRAIDRASILDALRGRADHL